MSTNCACFTQETEKHLAEIGASEEQVREMNRQLSSQMSQMVRDADEDKRQALEKYDSISINLKINT